MVKGKKYCCTDMEEASDLGSDVYFTNDEDSNDTSWYLSEPTVGHVYFYINYCPFCGKKLEV